MTAAIAPAFIYGPIGSADGEEARHINQHFQRAAIVVDVVVAEGTADPLGFRYERLQAGEVDAVQGRVQSIREVVNGLRARSH